MKIFKISIDRQGHFFNIDDHDLFNTLWLSDCIWKWKDLDTNAFRKIWFYIDIENGPDQEIMDYMYYSLSVVINVNENTKELLPYFQKAWQVIPLNMLEWKSFDDHWKDFWAKNKEDYWRIAENFAKGNNSGYLIKINKYWDSILKYDKEKNIFLSVNKETNEIRTFYKPDLKEHNFKTNLDYFNAQ